MLLDVFLQYFDSRPVATNQTVGPMPEYGLPVVEYAAMLRGLFGIILTN